MVTVASRRRILAPAAALLAATALSCTPSPVRWDDPAPLPADLVSATELTFDAQGRIVGRSPSEVPLPVFARQCITSVRIARDTIGAWYATWWSIRPDSTAEIVVSRSSDAQTWGPAIRVDSTDAGRVGCSRPPPSIAADRGNVHVAYAMTAKEGPGIFASHSMDQGRMFHSPVAVVYGERIGLTSIAARGDIVAVAYEDPNTDPRRIGLALSRTMAHLFQSRTLVSPATGPASGPAVGLGDGKIVVTWARGATTDASPPRVIRTGDLQ